MPHLKPICLASTVTAMISAALGTAAVAAENGEDKTARLPLIGISADGRHFVEAETNRRFVVWGFNYDHDDQGRLIEDYWHDEWETVAEDFREMRDLGANVVRVHLQLAKFMDSPDQPNQGNLRQYEKLLQLAEQTGLRLDVTGLGCYHKRDVPPWYDALEESARWDVQARFWRAIANAGADSPAIFCYDLMNEPILPGKKSETEWLGGEFAGKHFVQRIALDLGDRTRQQVARDWVGKLTDAIREVDQRHLITVGVIPWAHVFKNARPIFYDADVGRPLDFVSVHFYPKAGAIDEAVAALQVYDLGKPLVVEEFFPLHCSQDEAIAFVKAAQPITDGWISFYWGVTIDEYDRRNGLSDGILAAWLRWFQSQSPLKR